jgi:hypothetical protein
MESGMMRAHSRNRILQALVLFVPMVLFLLLLIAGCTMQNGGEGPTSGNQTPSESPPSTFLERTVPIEDIVQVNVQKTVDPPQPDIVVSYRGGPYQMHLSLISITVSRSDGITIRREIPTQANGMIIPSQSAAIQGTGGRDRVEVSVLIDGKYYKIRDLSL